MKSNVHGAKSRTTKKTLEKKVSENVTNAKNGLNTKGTLKSHSQHTKSNELRIDSYGQVIGGIAHG